MTDLAALIKKFHKHYIQPSAVFHKSVLTRAGACALVSLGYYTFCQRPDAKLNDVGEHGSYYFRVIGTCLSFLSVFISNMCYGRFWEARGHVGSVCHNSRCFARKLLYTTELHAGVGECDHDTIDTLLRYERAFFILLTQDLRVEHSLDAVPEDVLTADEKVKLTDVRRRSLMILAWMALLVRELGRNNHVSPRMESSLNKDLDQMSEAFHGCTKIKSQPLPFSYAQLIAMLTMLFCLTVPITFMSSFGWLLAIPTFVMGVTYFGLNRVANSLQDPFGKDEGDINLDGFADQLREDFETYKDHWHWKPAHYDDAPLSQRLAHIKDYD